MDEIREPTFLVLCALADGPKHGYAIRQDVALTSGGEVELRTGTLYAALDRLSGDGWIERTGSDTVGGRVRFQYALTATGRRTLAAEAAKRRAQAELVTTRLAAPGTPTTAVTA